MKPPKTYEPMIYALRDPETDEIRYVGFTINKAQRLYSHISFSRRDRRNSPKSQWIRSLLERCLHPKWNVLEEISSNVNWQIRECYWIDKLRRDGCNLTNIHPGGNGGQSHIHEGQVTLPLNVTPRLVRMWAGIAYRSEYARKLLAKYKKQRTEKK